MRICNDVLRSTRPEIRWAVLVVLVHLKRLRGSGMRSVMSARTGSGRQSERTPENGGMLQVGGWANVIMRLGIFDGNSREQ